MWELTRKQILSGVYAVGYVVCNKYAYHSINRKKCPDEMNYAPYTQRLHSTTISVIVSVFWPVLLPFLVVGDLDRKHREAKGIPSKKDLVIHLQR